jgi:uncharacterized protein YdhG (YjbR/CyaY superfamily)
MKNEVRFTPEVSQYIGSLPKHLQARANALRLMILQLDPAIQEGWGYGMPAYKYNKKVLVYFCLFDHHTGFYATPHAHEHFQKQLTHYKQGKGSVQFPHDVPLPMELIEQMAQYKLNSLK